MEFVFVKKYSINNIDKIQIDRIGFHSQSKLVGRWARAKVLFVVDLFKSFHQTYW